MKVTVIPIVNETLVPISEVLVIELEDMGIRQQPETIQISAYLISAKN